MAGIDYGAIAFKDGVCIQEEEFNDMKKSVGYETEKQKGNFFSYVGDKYLTACFYKSYILFISNGKPVEKFEENSGVLYVGVGYVDWKKYENYIVIEKDDGFEFVDFTIKNLGYNSYDFRMEYNGHKYRCVYGYGIDYPFYKRTKRFNYYRSIEFKISSIKYKISNIFYNLERFVKNVFDK